MNSARGSKKNNQFSDHDHYNSKDSFMHMSVNSVVDERFIGKRRRKRRVRGSENSGGDDNYYDEDGSEGGSFGSCSSRNTKYTQIKQQMIRYLSRVADRNKPMFVFN